MTAPDPLREDEVIEVAKAIYGGGAAVSDEDWSRPPAKSWYRDEGRFAARAAILRLDEMRKPS
jgi:hypothetical protein